MIQEPQQMTRRPAECRRDGSVVSALAEPSLAAFSDQLAGPLSTTIKSEARSCSTPDGCSGPASCPPAVTGYSAYDQPAAVKLEPLSDPMQQPPPPLTSASCDFSSDGGKTCLVESSSCTEFAGAHIKRDVSNVRSVSADFGLGEAQLSLSAGRADFTSASTAAAAAGGLSAPASLAAASPAGGAMVSSGGSPPASTQPLPSSVINKQPLTADAQYMQQQSHIFVFSTQLANKAFESVMQSHFPTIIAYHCAQPGTKKYLDRHPLKLSQFSRGGPHAPWLNSNGKRPAAAMNRGLQPMHGIPDFPGQGPGGMPRVPGPGMSPAQFAGQTSSAPMMSVSACSVGAPGGGLMTTSSMTSGPGSCGPADSSAGDDGRPLTSVQRLSDEDLTPEQRQHRASQLATLKRLGEMLLPDQQQLQQASAAGGSMTNGPAVNGPGSVGPQQSVPSPSMMASGGPGTPGGPMMAPLGSPMMGPDGPMDPRMMGPGGGPMGPRTMGPGGGPMDSRMMGPGGGPMDPRAMGPGGPMDPRMMGPGGGPMDPRMMGPGGPLDRIGSGGPMDHRMVGPNGPMDPRMGSGGPMDPRMGPGGPMDPRMGPGGSIDPRMGPGGPMDPRMGPGGPMDPRMMGPGGPMDVRMMGPGGPMDGRMMGPGGPMDVRMMGPGGSMDPRMMAPGGPMDPRMMCPAGQQPRMMMPGGPMMTPNGPPSSIAAQMEWQRLQSEFYDDRRKKGVMTMPGVPAGMRMMMPSSRMQGPPPPYPQSQPRPACPLTGAGPAYAISSPNANTNSPTTSLPKTSPRLNSPAMYPRLPTPGPSPHPVPSPSPRHFSNPGTPASVPASPAQPSVAVTTAAGRVPAPEFTPPQSQPPVSAPGSMSPSAVCAVPCSQQQQQLQPGGDMFSRSGLTTAGFPMSSQHQQQKDSSANLMPVPSPQQIQYINNFEGQELTIHKQPNTGLRETDINSPSVTCTSMSDPSAMCLPGLDTTACRTGPSTPLTPIAPPLTPGGGVDRFAVPSPQQHMMSGPGTPGLDNSGGKPPRFPGPDCGAARFPGPGCGVRDVASAGPRFPMGPGGGMMRMSSGGPMMMQQQRMPYGGDGGMSGRMSAPDMDLPLSHVPLNPQQSPVPLGDKMFDPISSMVQMSQQLTGAAGGSSPAGSAGSAANSFMSGGVMEQQSGLGGAGPAAAASPRLMSGGPMQPAMSPCQAPAASPKPNMPGTPQQQQQYMGPVGPGGMMPRMMGPGGMMVRPSNGPYSGGANVQVKPGAPNTIQYLPTRPQSASAGPRGPPSLDFLQRYTTPTGMTGEPMAGGPGSMGMTIPSGPMSGSGPMNSGVVMSVSGPMNSGGVVMTAGGPMSSGGMVMTAGGPMNSGGMVMSSGGPMNSGGMVMSSGGPMNSGGMVMSAGGPMNSGGVVMSASGVPMSVGNGPLGMSNMTMSGGPMNHSGPMSMGVPGGPMGGPMMTGPGGPMMGHDPRHGGGPQMGRPMNIIMGPNGPMMAGPMQPGYSQPMGMGPGPNVMGPGGQVMMGPGGPMPVQMGPRGPMMRQPSPAGMAMVDGSMFGPGQPMMAGGPGQPMFAPKGAPMTPMMGGAPDAAQPLPPSMGQPGVIKSGGQYAGWYH